MSQPIEHHVDRVLAGEALDRLQTGLVFEALVAGRLSPERVEAMLVAMADRGETIDEIVGAAEVMRRHVTRIACDEPRTIDTCGTGGDGISTFNVSTAAAIVAAGAGAVVAKHGNRTNTRASGSVEALEALGVNVAASQRVVERCIREARIGFLNAAKLHPAMGRVAELRRHIGRPTIFNLLGPLTNPAGVRRQVVGVPRVDLMMKVAEALARLGAERAFVVHGRDGLCDLTITGPSSYVEVAQGKLTRGELVPEDVGLAPSSLDSLRVAGPGQSAEAIRSILAGEAGPRRNHALLNAAVALVAAGLATDLEDGVHRSARSIDNGAAAKTLERWAAISGEGA